MNAHERSDEQPAACAARSCCSRALPLGAVIGAWFKDKRAFGALSRWCDRARRWRCWLAMYSPFAPAKSSKARWSSMASALRQSPDRARRRRDAGARRGSLRTRNDKRFEFPVLIALGVLGMFVMVSAQDLISLYVGVELQASPLTCSRPGAR
jgi:hypothetical protein